MKINIVELLKQSPILTFTIRDCTYVIPQEVIAEYQPKRTYVMSERQFAVEAAYLVEYIYNEVTKSKPKAQAIVYRMFMNLQPKMMWASKRFRLYREITNIARDNEPKDFYYSQIDIALMELIDVDFYSLLKDNSIEEKLSEAGATADTINKSSSYVKELGKVLYFE